LTIAKLNVDENPQFTQQYQVMSIPTMLLFKGGQPVEQLVGAMPKEALVSKLTPHIG
jgi:thioredoxin 1